MNTKESADADSFAVVVCVRNTMILFFTEAMITIQVRTVRPGSSG